MSSRAAGRVRGEFLPGDRVVSGGRKGVVHFMGLVKFATGKYVGVELDLPEGKHDGSMKGDRYFTCRNNHGIFVKPSMVTLDAEAPNGGMVQQSAIISPTAHAAAAASSRSSRRPSAEEAEHAAAASAASAAVAPRAHPVHVEPAHAPAPSTPIKVSSAAAAERAASLVAALETKQALKDAGSSPAKPVSAAASAAASPAFGAATAPKTTTFALPPLSAVKVAAPAAIPTAVHTPAAAPTTPQTNSSVLSMLGSPSRPSAVAVAGAALASADVQRVQSAYEELQRAHTAQTAELKAAQASLSTLQTQQTRAVDECKRLEQELSSRDRLVAELRTQVSESASGGSAIESLQNMVEMLTLDKALAEEGHEGAMLELTNLQNKFTNLELEHQLLQEQHAKLQQAQANASAQAAASVPSGGGALITSETAGELGNSAANTKLIEQNQLLTDALRRLRDLNLAEKQAATQRIGELEKQLAVLSSADKDNVQLREQIAAATANISSLKEQLDEALELQSMVESLSSQKLDLEETVREHARSIQYLQSLAAASEDVEDGYKELQAQLQSEIETKEADLIDLNQRYKLKTAQIEDLQHTNRKFRELVRQLESENQQLKAAQIDGDAMTTGAAKGKSGVVETKLSGLAATRSSSLLGLRLKQVRTAHLDALLVGVDRSLIEKRLQFLSLYLPANVTIDDRSLAFLQLLERVKSKSGVLARVWAEFYGGSGGPGSIVAGGDLQSSSSSSGNAALLASHKIQVDYSANGTTPELALLAYNACLLLASLIHAVENLTASLYTLDVDTYNSLCIRSMGELAPLDNIIDSYLTMIHMDTLNELTSLHSLVQANWVLYSFCVDKVPLPPTPAAADEFNSMPYRMALWTVVKRNERPGDETVQRWTELETNFKQRAAAATKRPALTGPAAALLPSAVPSLSTFALTLTYSTSLSQTLSQLVSDQLNSLSEAMRRGRKKLQLEESDARKKKERDDAIADAADAASPEPESSAPSNAALAEYSAEEDSDVVLFQNLFSEIADASLNNLTLANQLRSSMRNYHNSLGAANSNATTASDKEMEKARQESSVRTLLPHMHAIDSLAHTTALQLSGLLHAIQPLLQAENLSAISAAMTLEPSDAAPNHPVLQQLQSLLESANSKGASGDASLLPSLASLRTELFTMSKKLLNIIDDNTSAAGGASGLNEPEVVAVRAMHQRQASFVLTAPESALQAAPVPVGTDAASVANALPAVLSTLQPWFHHPLSVRAQLSASAALRIALQDLSSRLNEKQKEVYLTQRMVSEEKAKHDVLLQQLSLHTARANAQSEYAALNENLRAQVEESSKQLNLAKLELDKLSRENRAVRKQMLKLKQQYLKEEQTRAQIQAQQQQANGGASALGLTGASSAVGTSSSSAVGGGMSSLAHLSSLSSNNLIEVMQEVELLRRTLRATREELAHWKAKQTLHELRTQLLPPLPPIEANMRAVSRVPAMLAALPPISSGAAAVGAVLPPALGWSPTPFQASKLAGTLSAIRNPYIASLPPPLAVPASTQSGAAKSEADEVRLLRGKLSELAQVVWKARVAPQVVRIVDPVLERQQQESKEKEDAENSDEKTPSTGKVATASPSPFQQYVTHRVQAVQLQQCCVKLNQRINMLADQSTQHFNNATAF